MELARARGGRVRRGGDGRGQIAALAVALLLLLAALPARADEQKLTGDQIHQLLAGNSVHGMWGQTEYKSFFEADGLTVYHAKGQDPSRGRWRTSATQYCSTWRDAESCYDIYQDGDKIIWVVPEDGHRYSSTLVKGEDTEF